METVQILQINIEKYISQVYASKNRILEVEFSENDPEWENVELFELDNLNQRKKVSKEVQNGILEWLAFLDLNEVVQVPHFEKFVRIL